MRVLPLEERREHSDKFLLLSLKFRAQLLHNARIRRSVNMDGRVECDTHAAARRRHCRNGLMPCRPALSGIRFSILIWSVKMKAL